MRLQRSLLLCILALAFVLTGCQEGAWGETTAAPTTVATEPPVEQLSMIVTEDTIHQLEAYPSLKRVDLSGSTCYSAIAEYMKMHPKVDVTYTVQLGTVTVGDDEKKLELYPGACDYSVLAENLSYLPKVEAVSLPRTTYTSRELKALQGMYPDITWDFSVILLGQELTKETAQINLSVLEPEQTAEAAEIIGLFPNIKTVELMDAYGQSALSKENVSVLQAAAPNTVFLYSFEMFGKTISTTDTRIEYVKEEIGNEGVQELRSALAILKGCTYFLLDDCGIDYSVLSDLREAFPEKEVVWRVHVKQSSWLTDTDTIHITHHVDDVSCEPLIYCTKVRYMDVGPNAELTHIDFASAMPALEILILSGCSVQDLKGLSGAEKLLFLEMVNCKNIKDITPLQNCISLANINLSNTGVTDISPLYALPLARLYAVQSGIGEDSWERVEQLHPDCVIRYDGQQPYGTGWRYKKNGAYTEIYARVREVFGLDTEDGTNTDTV